MREELDYIGISHKPESYIQMGEITLVLRECPQRKYLDFRTVSHEEKELWKKWPWTWSVMKDLMRKVQEYTVRQIALPEIWEYDIIHAHDSLYISLWHACQKDLPETIGRTYTCYTNWPCRWPWRRKIQQNWTCRHDQTRIASSLFPNTLHRR